MGKINIDNNILPQNDLYKHVNNKWLKKTTIPNDEVSWSTFKILQKKNDNIIRNIVEKITKHSFSKDNTTLEKIKILYSQGNNTSEINKLQTKPIQKYLKYIDSENNLTNLIIMLHKIGVNPFFGISFSPDKNKSEYTIMYIHQSGLGLPNKLYYFDKDKSNTRNEYKKYIGKQLRNLHFNKSKINKMVDIIYNIEEELADLFYTPVEYRDINKTYNRYNLVKFTQIINQIDFKKYFDKIGLRNMNKNTFNIDSPSYYKKLNSLLKKIPLSNIKLYLKWRLINKYSSYLDSKIEEEQFNFYGNKLSGQTKMKPRWERILGDVESHLGEAIGKIYVKKFFTKKKKKLIHEMIMNIKSVFAKRIQNLDWMGDSTKKKAISKLKKMNFKIGHPKKWENYSKLKINKENTYFKNIVECNKYSFNYTVNKCYKPTDKNLWYMNTYTINAYYDPTQNEMVFPAGIFENPFFNEEDMAISYGGIGGVIAHEITHGFDDQGRQYSETGELRNWWTDSDKTKFEKKTNKLVDQFNKFKFHGVNVNGSLTLGENIADLGGLTIAYHAFKKYIKDHNLSNKNNSLDKQLFYNWANIWKNKMTKQALIKRINTDPHSPGELRVNAIVTNMNEFHDVFKVTSKNKLYTPPNKRIIIW